MFTRRREQLLKSAAAREAAGGPADEDWDNVVLLLNQQNVDAKQNQSFDDESAGNHSITANGDVTQGTFSPFSPNGWSNYFDGTSDGLSIAESADLALGSGDFTLEFWMKNLDGSTASSHYIVDARDDSTTGYIGALIRITTGVIGFYDEAGATYPVQSSTSFTDAANLNKWFHIVIERVSGVIKLFVNGTEEDSAAHTRNYSDSPSWWIAERASGIGGGQHFEGYLSNLRLVVGSNVYNHSVTVPTEPLTDITNTKLLTCQSNRFVDTSSSSHTITPTGSPEIFPTSPFGSTAAWTAANDGGSGYFDGTGDYLSIADNADFTQNTDYTFDAWVYPTAAGGSGGTSHTVYSHHNGTGNQRSFEIRQESGIWYVALSTDGIAQTDMDGTSTPILNAWTFIRVTYDGTTHRLYINGVNEGSAVLGSLHDSTEPVLIGDGGADPFQGYISSVRLIVGTALTTGTGSFTPPAAPPTAVTDTKLLLNFTNAGIYDASAKHNITLTGNTQTDTGVVKFAGASIELDGTSDTAATRATQVLGLGPAYTVEFWTYLDSLANEARFFRYISGGVTYGAIEGGGGAGGSNTDLQIQRFGTGVRLNGSGALSTGTWIHVAVTYDGTTSTLWINGTSADTYIGNVFPGASAQIILGDANSIDGRIEDFRVTAGVQRYTAAFTPPGNSFPIRGA